MEQMYCERFWKYREQFHLTQEELAERIGVSRQTVSKWERGESSPDTENLLKLSELYGVSIDDLLHSDPNPSAGGAQKYGRTAEEAVNGSAQERSEAGNGAVDAAVQSANRTDSAAPENGKAAGNGNAISGNETSGSASGSGNAISGNETSGNTSGSGNEISRNAAENGETASETAAEHIEVQTAEEAPSSADKKTDEHIDTEAQTAGEKPSSADENTRERVGTEDGAQAQTAEEEPASADDEPHERTGAESLTGVVAGVAAVGMTAVYLFLGFFLHLWHPGWLVFFLIPICALIAEAIDSKESGRFRWEVLTGVVAVGMTAVYLFLGCCLHLWHPGWLVFFLIPVWAIIAEAIDGKESGRLCWEDLTGAVAVGVTAVYLFLGCCLHLWHPGWLVFLLIPIWAIIAEAIDRNK